MTGNQILIMLCIFLGAALALGILVCLALVVGHTIGAITEWFVPGSRLIKAERKREKTLVAVFSDKEAFRIMKKKPSSSGVAGVFQIYSTGKRKVFLARFDETYLQPGTRTTEWAAIKIKSTWYPVHSMWSADNELEYKFIRNSSDYPSLLMMALHLKSKSIGAVSDHASYLIPLRWKSINLYGGIHSATNREKLETAVEKVIHDNIFTVDEIYTMYSNPELFKEQATDPNLDGIPLEFIQHMYDLPVDSLWGIDPQSKMLSPANWMTTVN